MPTAVPTDDEVSERYRILRSRYCENGVICELHGFNLIGNGRLINDMNDWIRTDLHNSSDSIVRERDGLVDRWLLEMYLLKKGRLGQKRAAFDLGMTEDSFLLVVDAFRRRGHLLLSEDGTLYDKSLIDNVEDLLVVGEWRPSYADYPQHCLSIHAQINRVLGVAITRVNDATSVLLAPNRPSLAICVDCIKPEEPVGLRQRIALPTDKPMWLEPDYISWKTFVTYESFFDSIHPDPTLGRHIPPDTMATLRRLLRNHV